MEESPTALDTKRLTIEARQALREAYVPQVGHRHTVVESALIKALSKLIHAVERSVQTGPAPLVFHMPEEPETKGDEPPLEELYASIMGRIEEPTGNTSQRKFVISFPDMELAVDEIWPEGDAPENPTPLDVIEVMKETEYAHPTTVAAAWLLIDSLSVRYNLDKDGDDQEVEWDGT